MYTPRSDGRIAITFANGTVRFAKDGTSVRASMDENLQQMVADNPAAAEQAREATSDFRKGLALDLGGLATLLAGAFVIAPGANPDGTKRSVSDGRQVTGGALALGGLIAIIAAFRYLTSAQARQFDAINIYNDGVGFRPLPVAAAPAVVSPVPLSPPTNVAPALAPVPPAPASPPSPPSPPAATAAPTQ